jgi:hypothetical protein
MFSPLSPFQSESREILQEVKRNDLTDIVMYAMTPVELPEFFRVTSLCLSFLA